MSEIIYIPKLARNALFAHLGAPRGCQIVVLSVHMPKTRHFGRIFGRKTVRTTTEFGLARPKQEVLMKTLNTPRLPRNAPFAHVSAPRGCQSVVLSVHMAKTRHSGRMFGRETARKRPKRDRISATTEFQSLS